MAVLGPSVGLLNHLGHCEAVTALTAFCVWSKILKVLPRSFQCLYAFMTLVLQSLSLLMGESWTSWCSQGFDITVVVLQELDFCSRIVLLLSPESQYFLLKGLLEVLIGRVWVFRMNPIKRNAGEGLILILTDTVHRILQHLHWHSSVYSKTDKS